MRVLVGKPLLGATTLTATPPSTLQH